MARRCYDGCFKKIKIDISLYQRILAQSNLRYLPCAIKSDGFAGFVGAGSKPVLPVMTRQPWAGLEPAPTNAY